MIYAGFWQRFGAGFIDHLFTGPLWIFGPFGYLGPLVFGFILRGLNLQSIKQHRG